MQLFALSGPAGTSLETMRQDNGAIGSADAHPVEHSEFILPGNAKVARGRKLVSAMRRLEKLKSGPAKNIKTDCAFQACQR